jgi:guanylate kinase
VFIEQFLKGIEEGKFLEYAEVHGNLYGTEKKALGDVAKLGKIPLVDVDVQGAMKIQEKASELKQRPHYIFITPPSLEVLEKRLRDRKTDSDEAIRGRLAAASREIEIGHQPKRFDYVSSTILDH